MAIKRFSETTNNYSEHSGTSLPDNAPSEGKIKEHQTADRNQIEAQYEQDAESNKDDKLDTGALIPKDMTVKLVRAESANWETFLSLLYSITLTLFGLYLGSWISTTNSSSSFSSLEIVAIFAFGGLSLALIIIWVVLKVRQQRQGVKIPYDMLNSLSDDYQAEGTARDV